MKPHALLILPRAEKEMKALPQKEYRRVKRAILALAEKPRGQKSKKLTGRYGRRIWIGRYRIIYEVNDQARKVVILHVGHRKDVYR